MNTEKLNYAMQYVDDDLLIEFFQMDDKLEAERKTTRRRHFRTFAAVASVMIFVILTGVIFNKRMNDVSEKTTAIATGIDLAADPPILLNQEKYHMFADSPFVRGYLAEHGFPSDYGADTIGEKRGYLDMAANKVDGRLCFSSTEEKTNYILYSYGNTNEDEFLIIQSDNHYYLLIKEGIAD